MSDHVMILDLTNIILAINMQIYISPLVIQWPISILFQQCSKLMTQLHVTHWGLIKQDGCPDELPPQFERGIDHIPKCIVAGIMS